MPIIASRASAAYGAGFSRVVTTPYLGPFGAYDSLATFTSPAAASINFYNIPTGYKHLQIRGIANNGESSGYNNQAMRFNGNTGTGYTVHSLSGNGAGTATCASLSSAVQINDAMRIPAAASGFFGAFIIDILDYSSVTKTKTVRILTGGDSNGSGHIGLHSGLWYVTPEAITSITINSSVGNFGTNTKFSLYGVK